MSPGISQAGLPVDLLVPARIGVVCFGIDSRLRPLGPRREVKAASLAAR
jgi:hypothetical protein